MANVGTLSIKFTGDARQLERTFTKIGVKANLAAGVIEAGFRSAVGAAKGFVTQALNVARENENTITSFKNLTGSISTAKELYADLTEFASQTPFARAEITSATTTLLGFGLSARDAATSVRELGAAAAANADTDLKRLVVSYGQIQGANVAMTRDLREFVNNGIPIYQLLADTLDVPVSKLNDMASQGQITGDIITRVFREAASEGGRFADTLVDQSQTFSGLVSTMKDNYAITLGQIGETLLPAAKEAAKGFNDVLLDMQSFFASSDGEDWALSLGATVRAVFESAGSIVRTEIANIKKIFAEFAEFFARTNASIVANPLSLFSQEQKVLAITNLAAAEKALAEVNTELQNTIENGTTFGEALAEAKLDASLAKVESRLASLNDGGGTGGSGGGTGGGGFEGVYKKIQAINDEVRLFGNGIASIPSISQNVISEDQFTALTATPQQARSILPETGAGQGEIDPAVLAIERQIEATEALEQAQAAAAQAASIFANEFTNAQQEGANASRALAIAVVESSKKIIGALIREGVTAAITNALKGPAGKVPILGIALAGLAGGLAQALFNSIIGSIKIPAFGDGGVVFGPTLALIGEKGPEEIVPLGRNGNRRSNEVHIRGVQRGHDTYWTNANADSVGKLIYGG